MKDGLVIDTITKHSSTQCACAYNRSLSDSPVGRPGIGLKI